MRDISFKPQIKRDFKRMKKRGKDLKKIDVAARILATVGTLPSQYRPHKLSGKYEGLWECHLESDWLLIFAVLKKEIVLSRTGSHADLFE